MDIGLENEVKKLALEAISDDDSLFLVDVVIKGNSGNQKVLVFIDGDHGISIDNCGKVGRAIGSHLEENDSIDGKYTLEVSSPGLDFPLKLTRQYQKNVGRQLEVIKLDGSKEEGALDSVNEEEIILKVANENKPIGFKEIKQSKVKVSFK